MAGVEAELSPTSKYAPFSVTEGIIARAKNGEEDAFVEIDSAVRDRLTAYFYLRLPEEAEDLAQITATRVARGVSRFPASTDKPIADQFTYWTFGIARNVLTIELRERTKRKIIFTPHNLEDHDESTDALLSNIHFLYQRPSDEQSDSEDLAPEEKLDEWVVSHLTGRQYYIYVHQNVGEKKAEIMKFLDIDNRTYKQEATAVRQILEEQLLNPSGFQQVMSFQDASVDGLKRTQINSALKKGRIPSLLIFGRHYSTSNVIADYLDQKHKHTLPTVAVDGYVLLSDIATQGEYSAFMVRPTLRELLHFESGRAFVKIDAMNKYREEKAKKRKKSTIIEVDTPEGYSRLSDIATTLTEYSRYRHAALKGTLSCVRLGKILFVKAEDLEKYKNQT